MKNLLIILAAGALTVMACKSVEQYRAPIEALTAEWSKTGEMVMNTTSQLENANTFLGGMVDSFKIDSTKKWSNNALADMNEARTAFMAQVQGLSGLVTEVNDFKSKWQSMTADVDALSTGLKNGKLEGDVMAKINDLKANSATAISQCESWNKNIMGAQATAVKAWDMFKQALTAK